MRSNLSYAYSVYIIFRVSIQHVILYLCCGLKTKTGCVYIIIRPGGLSALDVEQGVQG